jgi:carboxymethylenebutenolidase
VTPLQRYIAEEIATDHVDGLLTRREAMRRLALLGIGAAAATALIAACGEETKTPSGTSGASPTTSGPPAPPPGSEKTLPTAPVNWAGPAGELEGAWAEAPNARGGVLVIHENKGLNDWVRSVAGRLAGVGYSALAIDLLSEEGGTATFTDPAQATVALSKVTQERFTADLKSGVDELMRRLPGTKLAVVGFCFGGGQVWQLLAAGEPRLAAAVPFYGPLPDNVDFSGSKQAAVLAFYGSLDTRVTSSEQAARAALEKASMVNELIVEQGADHAFFNDTGPRYNPMAAADAWTKLKDWLGRYVG